MPWSWSELAQKERIASSGTHYARTAVLLELDPCKSFSLAPPSVHWLAGKMT
jgi:hypothetical protein